MDVIHKIMSPFGNVLRIAILHRDLLSAMVEFDSPSSAEAAVAGLQDREIYAGCCKLHTEIARQTRVNVHSNTRTSWDYTLSDQPSVNTPTPSVPYPPNPQQSIPPMPNTYPTIYPTYQTPQIPAQQPVPIPSSIPAMEPDTYSSLAPFASQSLPPTEPQTQPPEPTTTTSSSSTVPVGSNVLVVRVDVGSARITPSMLFAAASTCGRVVRIFNKSPDCPSLFIEMKNSRAAGYVAAVLDGRTVCDVCIKAEVIDFHTVSATAGVPITYEFCSLNHFENDDCEQAFPTRDLCFFISSTSTIDSTSGSPYQKRSKSSTSLTDSLLDVFHRCGCNTTTLTTQDITLNESGTDGVIVFPDVDCALETLMRCNGMLVESPSQETESITRVFLAFPAHDNTSNLSS